MRSAAVSMVGALVMVSLAACTAEAPVAGPTPTGTTATPGSLVGNAEVDVVVDGDTIDVLIGGTEERVRLTGIDTPERERRDSGAPAECFANEATAFTESLLPVGTPVRLERDVVGRDDYGRLLAYVYRADDGLFVNREIVRRGYAQPLTIPPNVTFSDTMVEAAREAELDDIGLWSVCS